MKDNNPDNIYCTNMDKDDPLIEKFMKEYVKEKAATGQKPGDDDLIVNFDITYADGTSENYTCGSESRVFGKECDEEFVDDSCKKDRPKVDKDKTKDKCEKERHHDDNYYCDDNQEKRHDDYLNDFDYEPGKWANCSEEWCESSKGVRSPDYDMKDHIQYDMKKVECKPMPKGKITVYSILSCDDSSTLKGVKINLYKLNGIAPELRASKETDYEGKVVFDNIEDGSYRVIEIIDKRYFEKPTYLNWNEFTINCENDNCTLYVLNSLRQYRKY